MNMSPFERVYIDITGKCNAHCPFCERGARRFGLLPKLENAGASYMDSGKFERIFRYLLENNIITKNAWLHLYNWGEPLINPYFRNIMAVIKDTKTFNGRLVLSSNGGNRQDFDRKYMPDLPLYMIFTIPGFSQASYDRGNSFKFSKVISNIEYMVKKLQALPNVHISLTYLVFKYNMGGGTVTGQTICQQTRHNHGYHRGLLQFHQYIFQIFGKWL